MVRYTDREETVLAVPIPKVAPRLSLSLTLVVSLNFRRRSRREMEKRSGLPSHSPTAFMRSLNRKPSRSVGQVLDEEFM